MIDNLFSSTLEGFILHDTSFSQAVRQQKALLDIYPSSVAVLGFRTLAQQLLATPEAAYPKGGIQFLATAPGTTETLCAGTRWALTDWLHTGQAMKESSSHEYHSQPLYA